MRRVERKNDGILVKNPIGYFFPVSETGTQACSLVFNYIRINCPDVQKYFFID